MFVRLMNYTYFCASLKKDIMKKKIYTPPILEELSVDDMQLLAGSGNSGTTPNPGSGPSNPDLPAPPPGAREDQFNEFE